MAGASAGGRRGLSRKAEVTITVHRAGEAERHGDRHLPRRRLRRPGDRGRRARHRQVAERARHHRASCWNTVCRRAGRSVPLLDAQRAIRTVRANAKEWGVDPAKVGIIGFSAGGHLASTAGTHFDGGDPKAKDAGRAPGLPAGFHGPRLSGHHDGREHPRRFAEQSVRRIARPEAIALFSEREAGHGEDPADVPDPRGGRPHRSGATAAPSARRWRRRRSRRSTSNSPPATTALTATRARCGTPGRPGC